MLERIYQHLSVALDVPVLLPENLLLPAEWMEVDASGDPIPDGQYGLHIYLRDVAPKGYVQLYDGSMGFTLSGWADNVPLQIDTIATSRALAYSLGVQVRDLLAATPRKGGRRQTMTPPFVSQADSVAVRVSQRFNAHTPYFKGSDL